MKILQTIVLFNLINLSCLCQAVPEKSIPADQVFLHFSRNLYHPGDTIKFQAYVRDRTTGIFETKSLSLHALLLNSSGHPVDSARFRIVSSSANGWLAIPGNVPGGSYSVISYTGSMMNYDPRYIFSAALEITSDQLNGIPFKDGTREVQKANQTGIKLEFIPESGTFLYGFRQRLVFRAYSGSGELIPVQGTIFNQNNSKITEFSSGEYGTGIIEFVPNPGDSYFARLNGSQYAGKRWSLPVPSSKGASLRLLENKNGVLDFLIRGQDFRDTINLLLSMNGYPMLRKQINPDSLYRMKINTDELPAGTGYLSLLDNRNKTLAERAVFINYHKIPHIEINRDSSRKGEIVFSIRVKNENKDYASSIVTVSVIDSASGFSPKVTNMNISGSFLLDKRIFENIPSFIEENLSDIGAESLDLLLMAFCRRDSLQTSSINDRKDIFNDYDALKIITPGRKKAINIFTLEGSESYTIESADTIANLSYSMLGPSARQFMILPDKTRAGSGKPVKVEFPGNSEFTDEAKKIQPVRYKGVVEKGIEADFSIDSAIAIEGVTIQAKQVFKPVIYNKYQVQFQNTQTKTYSKKDFKAAVTFEDILFLTLPYQINTRTKMVSLGSRIGRISGGGTSALIVLDDNPLWVAQGAGRDVKWISSYDQIATMPASNISSITVVNGPQAFNLYGEAALGGVIFVVTDGAATREGYMQNQQEYSSEKNEYIKPIRIFRTELNNENERDRSTIYWNRELYIPDDQPATISIPGKLIKGTFYIIINGATMSNVPVSLVKKISKLH
jgi:hypothetical protein